MKTQVPRFGVQKLMVEDTLKLSSDSIFDTMVICRQQLSSPCANKTLHQSDYDVCFAYSQANASIQLQSKLSTHQCRYHLCPGTTSINLPSWEATFPILQSPVSHRLPNCLQHDTFDSTDSAAAAGSQANECNSFRSICKQSPSPESPEVNR